MTELIDQRGDWRLTDALTYEQGRGDPFAAAVRATRMPMVITNPRLPDNPIVYCNQAFQDLSGYERDEIVGRNCRFLQGPDTDRSEIARIRTAIAHGQDVKADLLNYRKNGTTFWNALYLSPVRDDAGEIGYYFASQFDVTDRRDAEQRAIARREEVEREVAARTADLQGALAAKTLLLHELDHRVKNNLAMIGSVLRLQARATDQPAISVRLEAMLQRVDALGAVHRRLYQSTETTRFDMGAFLAELGAEIAAAAGPSRISLVTDIVPLEINPAHASALGLVLNELLLNAVEHAFADGRTGTLRLRTALAGPIAQIDIADNGPGIAAAAPGGLGRTLVARLSHQLGITVDTVSTAAGTRVSLSLPLANLT